MMTTTTASGTESATVDPHSAQRLTWRHGHVAWFNAEKGFGFVDPDDGGESVFVRHTAILAPGYKTLVARQSVVFAVADSAGDKPEAAQVLTYADSAPVPPVVSQRRAPRPRWWQRRCRREHASAD